MKSTQIASQLWARLWQDYSHRVQYARIYQQMLQQAGGAIANDHIAFRSLRLSVSGMETRGWGDAETRRWGDKETRETTNSQFPIPDSQTTNNQQPTTNNKLGIPYIANLAEALGYEVAGEYNFAEQHVYARHYRHPEQDRFDLPKLFISELLVDSLPAAITQLIKQTVSDGSFYELDNLNQAIAAASTTKELETIVTQLQGVFTRPWQPPRRSVVEAVNAVSQYGAWVLLHGYAVNHFTAYVNRQNTPLYPDIESTARGLAELGIPMKTRIEGNRGSGLRQTATHAVTEMVLVQDDTSGKLVRIPWTYAYYEIAERNLVEIAPGQQELFEGFLRPQAQNLFELTRN
ncbi:MAG: DUF1338 domain-containing protein [Symploca sp. SIO3E6]|nr:DUF1338 domain-containing protein [Caldora sp. SIO3E6]